MTNLVSVREVTANVRNAVNRLSQLADLQQEDDENGMV